MCQDLRARKEGLVAWPHGHDAIGAVWNLEISKTRSRLQWVKPTGRNKEPRNMSYLGLKRADQESRKNPESAAMTLRWHLFNVPANPLSCRADGQTVLSEEWLVSRSDCFSIVLTKINPERDTRRRAYSLRATIAAGSWQSESAGCLSMYNNESSIGWNVSIWGSEVEFHGVPSWCQEPTWIGSSCGVSVSSFCWTHYPRCESRKNWKWILLFDVSSVVSSLKIAWLSHEPLASHWVQNGRPSNGYQPRFKPVLVWSWVHPVHSVHRSVKNARLLQGETSRSCKV